MTIKDLTAEDLLAFLPPHNPALALMHNGRWVQTEDRYELRAWVNRLGNRYPFIFGWISAEFWESADRAEVQEIRAHLTERALRKYWSGSWMEKMGESPPSVSHSNGIPTDGQGP